MGALRPRWFENAPPQIRKQVVDTIRGLWWFNGKARPLPKVAQVRGRRGSVEATQNQVVLYVVPCVLDRHVLEQTTVCAQDVVGTGAQLLYPAEYALCPSIPQSQLAMWEEVPTHVLKTRREQVRRDIFIPCLDL